ncbi:MAG: hypothetical protein AAF651_08715 [Cyanobacteria bacterium P01_C01_bin.73]
MALWLSWSIIMALAWAASGYLGAFIGFEEDVGAIGEFFNVDSNWEWGLTYGLIYGAFVGVSSWLFLRDRVRLPFIWIPLTIVGFTIGNGLGSYVVYDIWVDGPYGNPVFDSLYGFLNGLCIALVQSFVARQSRLEPLLWFGLTVAGVTVGEYIAWYLILGQLPYEWFDAFAGPIEAAGGAIAGAIFGGTTGIALLTLTPEVDDI